MNALLLLVLLAAPAPRARAEPVAQAVRVEAGFKRGRLEEHFKKHGAAMGYRSAEEYLAGARRLLAREDALQKISSDGDRLFLDPKTGEFAALSRDGRHIRTYFKPNNARRYWNRQ